MRKGDHLYWLSSRGWAWLLLTFITAFLAGCVTSNDQGGARVATPDISAQIREVDLGARSPQGAKSSAAIAAPQAQQVESYFGDGTPAYAGVQRDNARNGPEASSDPATTGALTEGGQARGYEMNFENAPVAAVARAILGDILNMGYTIDPRVQGTVSLSSGRPVPKSEILYVFESALRVANIALVREARGYRLVPAAEAVGT